MKAELENVNKIICTFQVYIYPNQDDNSKAPPNSILPLLAIVVVVVEVVAILSKLIHLFFASDFGSRQNHKYSDNDKTQTLLIIIQRVQHASTKWLSSVSKISIHA